jgi:hypothetical protein
MMDYKNGLISPKILLRAFFHEAFGLSKSRVKK